MIVTIRNGMIINGTGGPPTKGDLVVIDGRIQDVGPNVASSIKGGVDSVIEADGMYVLPGFINCHVHLSLNASTHPMNDMTNTDSYTLTIQGLQVAASLLKAGITTIRDGGSKDHEVLSIRNAINRNMIPGPRIIAAGRALLMTGGHFSGVEVDGVESCLAAARAELHAGADCIKVMATGGLGKSDEVPGAQELSFDELKACFDVARRAGKRSFAHAHGVEGIKDCVKAGVTSIEHGTMIDQEAIDMMIDRSTYLVPTFSPYWLMVEQGKQKGVPDYMIQSSRWVMKEKGVRFKMAVEKGLRIAFGTDGGAPITPHNSLDVECRCMIEGGMKPMDVILSLTSNAADLLGLRNKLGALEPGKVADIVILGGNPLEDIGQVANVVKVLQSGRIVSI
jgi:imidazolonepropionase-like amidohydrolase